VARRGPTARTLPTAAASALAVLAAATPAHAAVLTVANTNDAGAGSLRQAVATANTNGAGGASLVAADPSGNRSKLRRLTFTVASP
jgi:hypothetical protein